MMIPSANVTNVATRPVEIPVIEAVLITILYNNDVNLFKSYFKEILRTKFSVLT